MRDPRRILLAMVFSAACAGIPAHAAVSPGSGERKIEPSERTRVIAAVAREVRAHYVDHDLGQRMADALEAEAEREGEAGATAGSAFAGKLTRELRELSHDPELEVLFSADPLPQARAPSEEDEERYRERLRQAHCLIADVRMQSSGIGYLKLDGFGDRATCEPAVRNAMARLNRARTLIIDLRDNRGGMPEMVEFLAGYFFDHPEYWFNPREAVTAGSWTASPVPGNRLADKPVFVLTSARTISGGEQFCYDLKALKRATLVGETTAGAAHAGFFHRIDDHFGIAIPEVRPVNPYGPADWEGVGVTPDVRVKSEDALAAATRLAELRRGEPPAK